MSELFMFRYEELTSDEDEPEDAATLYRLHINDDSYDLTLADVASLFVNSHGYLKRLFPRAGTVPLVLKTALAGTAVITLDWLQLCPPAVTDPRLHQREVQQALLKAAARAFQYCGHNEEQMQQGAIDLLQARAAMFPAVKEACQNAVHEMNLIRKNPVKSYQNMIAAAVRDEDPAPSFDSIEEALRLDLENALFDCERGLRSVFLTWAGTEMEFTKQAITSAEKIAGCFIDELAQQYEDEPDRNVVLTKEMEHELIRLSHDFTFLTMTQLCQENRAALLCVSGPRTGELVYPDRHGTPGVRPLALFPLGLFEPDDFGRDT